MPSPDGADRRARLRISNAQTCPRRCAGVLCRGGTLYRQDDPDRRRFVERIAAMNCRPPHGRSAGAIVVTGRDCPIAGSPQGRCPRVGTLSFTLPLRAAGSTDDANGRSLRGRPPCGPSPLRRHRPRPFGTRPRPGGGQHARLSTRPAVDPTGYWPNRLSSRPAIDPTRPAAHPDGLNRPVSSVGTQFQREHLPTGWKRPTDPETLQSRRLEPNLFGRIGSI